MTDVPARLSSAIAERCSTIRRLGAGGMGTVYLAEDLRHDRCVAVKIAAVIGAKRFLAEIRTTANLQQPHIPARSNGADPNNSTASGGYDAYFGHYEVDALSRPWQHRACGFRVYRDRPYFTPGDQQSDI